MKKKYSDNAIFEHPIDPATDAKDPFALVGVWFNAETMPNGKSYPEKQVFGVEAIIDEMRLRNGRPWKGNEEAKLRE